MNRNKTNICLLLGLTALLLTAAVLLATGAAFARYREETSADVTLQTQKPGKVLLWAGTNPDLAYAPGAAAWETVDGEDLLNFMVTNADTDGVPTAYDQRFRLRMVAGLGFWDGSSELRIRLTVTEGEVSTLYYATAKPIEKNTVLHREYGDGWYFTFLDNKNRELYFTLDGGVRSTIPMQLTLEAVSPTDVSLLKLQVVGQPET